VRAVTDSPPVGRLIAAGARGRLVHRSAAFAMRELSGARRTDGYRLRGSELTVHVRHNTTDSSILDEIFLRRIYEPPRAVEERLRALERAPRIADLGANVGLFGAFALTRWPGATLLALEPHPQNAALLRRTVAVNHLADRWSVLEACAYHADGQLPFAVDHFSDSHVLAASAADDGGGEPASALVDALDVFPLLKDIDLVKIDIEGGEWALLGDPRMAELGAVAIALEYHPHLAPGPDARAEATRRLQGAGYTVEDVFRDPRGHGMLWAWRQARPRSPA
jgi:FkbM family methyltransferase